MAHWRPPQTEPIPCPLCGSPARVDRDPPPIPWRGYDWSVTCSETCCDEVTPVEYGATREDAVREWNRRPEQWPEESESCP